MSVNPDKMFFSEPARLNYYVIPIVFENSGFYRKGKTGKSKPDQYNYPLFTRF